MRSSSVRLFTSATTTIPASTVMPTNDPQVHSAALPEAANAIVHGTPNTIAATKLNAGDSATPSAMPAANAHTLTTPASIVRMADTELAFMPSRW